MKRKESGWTGATSACAIICECGGLPGLSLGSGTDVDEEEEENEDSGQT